MTFTRQQVGKAVDYNGHVIIVRFCGPDLLCEVDGTEMPNFYLDRHAAIGAGARYCDQMDREKGNA